MAALRRAHTSDLSEGELAAVRALLEDAFDGCFAPEDWEHTLGGVHVLASEDGELLGHASVVQRRLVLDGAGVRTGYVEAVAVTARHRAAGLGGRIMTAVGEIVRRGYDLGALSAGEEAARLYARHGWLRWEGPTWVLSPEGPVRTPDEDGSVHVLPTPNSPPLELSAALACDWRPGDVW